MSARLIFFVLCEICWLLAHHSKKCVRTSNICICASYKYNWVMQLNRNINFWLFFFLGEQQHNMLTLTQLKVLLIFVFLIILLVWFWIGCSLPIIKQRQKELTRKKTCLVWLFVFWGDKKKWNEEKRNQFKKNCGVCRHLNFQLSFISQEKKMFFPFCSS